MTSLLTLDPFAPDPAAIAQAASVIRAGGLVAFPTETVYGLGANALDAGAVGRIFSAKGRPATNPVIVHVADESPIPSLTAEWPEMARRLAARFWPGPLTLVVPKHANVPNIVTAGGPTVALRCPAHPIAAALIRAAGLPIAAPSANRSTELSPTRAEHVLQGLNGRIDLVLDGGPCSGGIESTVVDVTGLVPRLLRPGLITVPMLERIVGAVESGHAEESVARSPGQMAKHYSPRTPVLLMATNDEAAKQSGQLRNQGLACAWLSFGEHTATLTPMPTDAGRYAARLYDELHRLDRGNLHCILVTLPPDTPEWVGIRDRLQRAATKTEETAIS